MSLRRVGILAFVGLVAQPANAIEPFRLDWPVGESPTEIAGSFEVNLAEPELNRAWIRVEARTERFEGENRSYGAVRRIPVEGLKYDAASKRILYFKGANQVVCASVEESSRFLTGGQRVTPTGKCRITARVEPKMVDDGFFRKAVPHGTVQLEVVD